MYELWEMLVNELLISFLEVNLDLYSIIFNLDLYSIIF